MESVAVVDVGAPAVIPAWSARRIRMEHLTCGGSLGQEVELSCFYARKVFFWLIGFCFLFLPQPVKYSLSIKDKPMFLPQTRKETH